MRTVLGCVVGCLLVAPAARAQGQEPEQLDPTERVERILTTAESVGQRLGEPDAGEGTLKLQDDILADLDALIELAEQPPPPMNPQSPPPQPDQQPMPDSQGGGGVQRQQGPASLPDQGGPVRPSGSPMPRPGPQQAEPNRVEPTPGQPQGASAGSGPPVGGMSGDLAEYDRGVWGHLPEKLRRDLDTYYRDRFMPEYGDLLKQYYSSIAEAGRR